MLLVLSAMIFSACSGPAPAKNVSFTAAGADAAAYRVGSGSWQVPDDVTSFAFTATGAYEVAVRCGDDTAIWSVTKADTETVDLSCPAPPPSPISFTVTYNVTAVSGATQTVLFYNNNAKSDVTTSGTFNVTDGAPGTQDLVLVALDGTATPIAARMVTINASDGGSYDITMTASDTANVVSSGSVGDFSAQIPSGWPGGMAAVGTLTPNGTLVEGGFMTEAGGPYTAFAGGDYDFLYVVTSDVSGTKTLIYSAASTAPGAAFAVSLPATMEATVNTDAFPTVVGLSMADPDLRLFTVSVKWSSSRSINVMITPAFLGSSNAYTVPDLSSLPGFAGFGPASGDAVRVDTAAFMSSITTGDLLALAGQGGDVPFLPKGEYVSVSSDSDNYVVP